MAIDPGSKGIAEIVVGTSDLADALIQNDGDDFPPVFATQRMVGLMEVAASRVMHPELKPGELSVGVVVNVSHSAATAVGDTVKAEAVFTGMDGKFYIFDVFAYDSGGEIGRGTHKRAIIAKDRLLQGITKRLAK